MPKRSLGCVPPASSGRLPGRAAVHGAGRRPDPRWSQSRRGCRPDRAGGGGDRRAQAASPGRAGALPACLTLLTPVTVHPFFPLIPALKADFGFSESRPTHVQRRRIRPCLLHLVYGTLGDRYGLSPGAAGPALLLLGSTMTALATSWRVIRMAAPSRRVDHAMVRAIAQAFRWRDCLDEATHH